jgi:dTDP-glucose 4,6-dehydratase
MLPHKKILVTGAGGFIGSHLSEELVRQGCAVRAFLRYNSSNSWGWLDYAEPEIKKSLEIVTGDIRDPHGIKEAMKGCDVVLHLAALISIPYSYHYPASYVETNVSGTLNVVQAARELGVKKVVHTSTSEVYGTARFVPITEEHPLNGQSPYAASKIGADQMAMSFYLSFNTPVAIIRPFNTYGPRQSARAVISTIISQLASGNKPFRLGALHPTRDFNYVKDTVAGFIAVARSERTIGEVINIGSNMETSIGEIAKILAEIMEVNIEVETDATRLRPEKSEVERLLADNCKARQLAGWEPAYQGMKGLYQGLEETVEWFRNPAHRLLYKADLYNI